MQIYHIILKICMRNYSFDNRWRSIVTNEEIKIAARGTVIEKSSKIPLLVL